MSRTLSTKEEAIANSKKKTKKRGFTKEELLAYLFLSPFIIGLLLFYIVPSLASFYLSFTNWDGLAAPVFVGIENFRAMLNDPTFMRSILNTVVFTLVSVPLTMVFATIIATLLNQKIKGMVIYRTMYFIPVITMPVAVGMVWRWLYNNEFGLINYILSIFNIPPQAWLFDDRIALFAIIIASIWMTVGNSTIILLAGLQGISTTYYEAATIDGASRWKQYFKITLPLLTPSLFFVSVILMISSLQVFDLIFMMIGDNISLLYPTRTVVYSVWEQGFSYFNMGYASAQAFLLFITILFLTIIQMILQKKWVHY